MRFWRSIGLLTLALGVFALPAHAADKKKADEKKKEKAPRTHASTAPERRAWMIGLNYGASGARFEGTYERVIFETRSDTPAEYPPLSLRHPDWVGTTTESGSALQYRIGYAINPTLAIGFERHTWTKDFGPYSWRFGMSSISATYYPNAGHFFARGGAGIAALSEKRPTVRPFFLQYSDDGFGFEGALGYERRLYKRISVTPEVSVRYLTFTRAVCTKLATGSLGLNWWF